MTYVKQLQAVTQNELSSVGYKAQDLALMANNGVLVPPSVVVTCNAFDDLMRANNLKYKIDYILGHAQHLIESSLVNAYNGSRKAFIESKFPAGLELELRENYERVTVPIAIGELTTARPPVRIIVSTNRMEDPQNNDTIIQNVTTFDELLTGVKEAWALIYHPNVLRDRLKERFQENKLKVALIIQVMDEPRVSCTAYSCLPQDHHKVYLQVYTGHTDLRDKVQKDFYALNKTTLRVVAKELHQQTQRLARTENGEFAIVPLTDAQTEKLNDNQLEEIGRLCKKTERLLTTTTKCLFAVHRDNVELLLVNRLGFDIMIQKDEPQQADPAPRTIIVPATPAAIMPSAPSAKTEIVDTLENVVVEIPKTIETEETGNTSTQEQNDPADFIAPQEISSPVDDTIASVDAKLIHNSLQVTRQVLERKYRSLFGETPQATDTISDMVNRLNSASAFSKNVDGALLLQAQQAAQNNSHLSQADYAKAIAEIAFIMTYA